MTPPSPLQTHIKHAFNYITLIITTQLMIIIVIIISKNLRMSIGIQLFCHDKCLILSVDLLGDGRIPVGYRLAY